MNRGRNIVPKVILGIDKGFPENLRQLKRIALNYTPFDLVALSYVVTPLVEQKNIAELADNMSLLEGFCNEKGCVTILASKFIDDVVQKLGEVLKVPVRRMEYTQKIYSNENCNNTFTYSYYDLVYKPRRKLNYTKINNSLPNQTVAFTEITPAA